MARNSVYELKMGSFIACVRSAMSAPEHLSLDDAIESVASMAGRNDGQQTWDSAALTEARKRARRALDRVG
jgi:hypothetical protein